MICDDYPDRVLISVEEVDGWAERLFDLAEELRGGMLWAPSPDAADRIDAARDALELMLGDVEALRCAAPAGQADPQPQSHGWMN